ncbi:MAG: 2-amino-4-hydroxy-6-hydroxymethyldihydropteridine diphosphokinase [Lentisphaerae bacterium]|nr:2-amino-4-hydroxy-6-hydroxymethyldihydropteridine diphosphokinase [Lentisphaerota bacterium]
METGISLGSNTGDRLAHLKQARARMAALEGVTVSAASRVYETEPVDVRPEHAGTPFLNAVLVLDAAVSPARLARGLLAIETELGRVRGADRNAPRPIDLDIIYAGDAVIREDGLRVPHPRWAERRFVVQGLADVRPGRVLPGERRAVREVLAALPERPWVRLFERQW